MTEASLVLSVRDLVEFSARSGDLYWDSGGPTHVEGLAVHREVQSRRDSDWQKEYALKQTLTVAGFAVTLQGRADLVNELAHPVIVEEIKSTYLPSEQIAPGKKALFWAQARLYAYLHALAQTRTPQQYQLRLTLVNARTFAEETEVQEGPYQALEDYALTLLTDYVCWYRQVLERRKNTAASARTLNFPHAEFRPGQRALAASVYRCLRAKQSLLAEAPTGIGKTVSTLFPAVKALGEGLVQQVVYLTAKTSGQRQAEQTLHALRERGLGLDHLTLCARDKICPCRVSDEALDSQGRCRLTLGFYDRLPEARQACLEAGSLDVQRLSAIAHRHQLCPFALGQHLLPWSTLVIGDYNYFYDPLASASGFAHGASTRALLVDEAHNLPQRGREMFSARLTSDQLTELARAPVSPGSPVAQSARRLRRLLQKWTESFAPVTEQLPKELPILVEELVAALQAASNQPEVADLFTATSADRHGDQRAIYRFRAVLQRFGPAHKVVLKLQQSGAKQSIEVNLLCLDAGPCLQEGHAKARSIIAFSATLSPQPFFKTLLGLADAQELRLESPFPATHGLVLRCGYIDTRWRNRQSSIRPLAELVATVFAQKPGKYMVFFASYDYLQQVFQTVRAAHSDWTMPVQSAGATTAEQSQFLQAFLESTEPALGFAILGGSFAEGIDYRGDALHGAIVVGTGMPQPSLEQRLMQAHFEGQQLDGFQYAYQLPGLARVLQSAGRVIRSEHDRGVILLVDPRYRRRDYRALMPLHWTSADCEDQGSVVEQLAHFWHQPVNAPCT